MSSVYIVEITSGARVKRVVVVAASATDAAKPYKGRNKDVEVGRLGTFEPGFTGALMHAASGDELVSGLVKVREG